MTYKTEFQRAKAHHQEHIFQFWNELDDKEQNKLLAQAKSINYAFLEELYKQTVLNTTKSNSSKADIKPPTLHHKYNQDPHLDEIISLGEKAIENGKVAFFTPAGGQASRLGYSMPKGCFPITPITEKCLFAVLAEKILAAEKKYNVQFQWHIMINYQKDKFIKNFFDKHDYFGLSSDQVFFIHQGMLPSVDKNGRILLKEKNEIFLNPNGTGGIYDALVKGNSIKRMKKNNVKYMIYFQIDNPLITILDPLFLGYHINTSAEMSTKVVEKKYPEEKVGLVVQKNSKTSIVEYIELSDEMAHMKNDTGKLTYNAANIAMHIINVNFIERIQERDMLSYYAANKKIPYVNKKGETITPETNNGVKFESFVFDALPKSKDSITYMVPREEEFAPVKNASGKDSPESSKKIQRELYKKWLSIAGIDEEKIKSIENIEVSPLFAVDKEEFIRKITLKKELWEKTIDQNKSILFE
ncbi:MAG: UTP--glucose-1-phosphate uridylyltransferase [Nanobdellota archaeon]